MSRIQKSPYRIYCNGCGLCLFQAFSLIGLLSTFSWGGVPQAVVSQAFSLWFLNEFFASSFILSVVPQVVIFELILPRHL